MEFDNPPNHSLLNAFSSQPMRGPVGSDTPTDTMWAGTMWTNENWRWIFFFFRELGMRVSNGSMRRKKLKCAISQSKACI